MADSQNYFFTPNFSQLGSRRNLHAISNNNPLLSENNVKLFLNNNQGNMDCFQNVFEVKNGYWASHLGEYKKEINRFCLNNGFF